MVSRYLRPAIVLVAYDVSDSVGAIQLCNAASQLLRSADRVMVLNRNIEAELATCGAMNGWTVLRGTNEHNEFSAWQQGLSTLVATGRDYSSVVFANDSVGRPSNYLQSTSLLALITRIAVQNEKEAIGVVHRPRDGGVIEIESSVLTQWMCTLFFSVSWTLLRKMACRIDHWERLEHLVELRSDRSSLMSGRAPESLRTYIDRWLLGGEWYGCASPPLTDSDFARLTRKAQCVLNELYLSASVQSHGGRVVAPFIDYDNRAVRGLLRMVDDAARIYSAVRRLASAPVTRARRVSHLSSIGPRKGE